MRTSTVDESGWVDGKLIGRRIERLGAITLRETPLADPPFTVEGLRLEWLNWTPKAILTRQRLAFLHATYGPPWPDVSDAALLARAQEWLDGKDVNLRRLVTNNRLDELAPERVRGQRVNYEDPTTPTIAVKVQDAFGWTEAPKIGHITVLVHLLSPAGRPVAVTRDLASFWRTGYPRVRAELRGRYPRHSWPSQPGADRPA